MIKCLIISPESCPEVVSRTKPATSPQVFGAAVLNEQHGLFPLCHKNLVDSLFLCPKESSSLASCSRKCLSTGRMSRAAVICYLVLILEVLWTPGHPHPSHSTQILQEGVEGHRKSFPHKTLSCCGPRQLTLAPKSHSLYPLSSMKWEGSLYKIVLNTISFQLQLQERWKEGLPALRQLPSYEPSAPF